MISQASLPQELIPRCMDVLSKISNSERDLIRVVVDVVTELREGDGEVDDGVSFLRESISASEVLMGAARR